MTLTQAKCNKISEKPGITSFLTEENDFVADNKHDSGIEDTEIVMEIYPTTNSTQDIPHENLKILATECGNATEDVISLNNDVYNTVFVSKKNVSFSSTEEILRDNTDESQLPESSPEHFVQGNGNEDKNNEFEKTSKINILKNIVIQNNNDGPHYKADEVDANNLQHKENCSESEDPCYLPEESSDTNELEEEQEEEAVEIRETKGKKRKGNSNQAMLKEEMEGFIERNSDVKLKVESVGKTIGAKQQRRQDYDNE
ncbi:hypothetical protein FQA39_LY10975 [Lamprigera yunnana]|nr:hypothetical protein FQA39_LY10975 [Lamprigera yunnana]